MVRSSNSRQEYVQAQRSGTEMEAWVIKQSRTWDDPTVSAGEIAEAFDLSRDKVVDRLIASEMIDGKQVGSEWIFW